jgi:hypothetical protein
MSADRPSDHNPPGRRLADAILDAERALWTVLVPGSECEKRVRNQVMSLVAEAYDLGYAAARRRAEREHPMADGGVHDGP